MHSDLGHVGRASDNYLKRGCDAQPSLSRSSHRGPALRPDAQNRPSERPSNQSKKLARLSPWSFRGARGELSRSPCCSACFAQLMRQLLRHSNDDACARSIMQRGTSRCASSCGRGGHHLGARRAQGAVIRNDLGSAALLDALCHLVLCLLDDDHIAWGIAHNKFSYVIQLVGINQPIAVPPPIVAYVNRARALEIRRCIHNQPQMRLVRSVSGHELKLDPLLVVNLRDSCRVIQYALFHIVDDDIELLLRHRGEVLTKDRRQSLALKRIGRVMHRHDRVPEL
mmetsp:Transcript_10608/g.26330  ORF Transcript_10608/g.26330 Transcript_10608/m.26330 type:complete len:283 (+) Transcript_10608:57-905(+)